MCFFLYFIRTFKCPAPSVRKVLLKEHKETFCCCSVTQSCPTVCDPMDSSTSLSFTIFWNLLKLMSIESVMPSNRPISCRSLLFLPSLFPASASFQVSWFFASGGQSIGASASASVLPMTDWFDLLVVQRTLKSLLQHHRLKASILRHSAFFMVQFSHSYMTTVKSIWKVKVAQSCPTLCDPMDCSPWNSPGQYTGVGSCFLLQGIFPTQGSNPGLPHCRQSLSQLSHKGSLVDLCGKGLCFSICFLSWS